ncbi:hypothetical protein AMJ47_02855 [Parcubacteria bacterium DG_72]|nr:MAG: hypothetical protein AMJ47_02855 [Parcubacteria bacterium DG_72]
MAKGPTKKDLIEENDQLKRANEQLRENAQDYSSRLTEARSQIDLLTSRNNQSRSKINTLESKKSELEKKLQQSKEKEGALSETVKSLEKEIELRTKYTEIIALLAEKLS